MNNELKTLGAVSQRVNTLSRNCNDSFVNVKDLEFENLETVKISGAPYHMRKVAQISFCNRLGVPHHYLKKCSVALQAENLNYWLPAERNEKLFFRFDGSDVRAVFTSRYKPIDNYAVLERIYDLGFNDETKVKANIDSEFMSLNILEADKAFDINGDKFRQGANFSNSEVGLASLSITAYTLRIICTNGMLGKTGLSRSFKHVSEKVLCRFPEILSGVANELSLQKDRFKISMNSPVDFPQNTLETFNRQFGLGPNEKDAVEWAWPYEEGKSMFNIINTYTKSSQFPDLSAASIFKLQKTGGQILELVK